MIPLVGLALAPKLLILAAVFLALVFLLRGRSILEKLTVYSILMLAAVFFLLRAS